MWRKENLATNRLATLRLQQIRSPGEVLGRPYTIPREPRKPFFKPPSGVKGEILSAAEDAIGQMQMESIDNLMKDLAVEERLDGLIDRCLKRLLFVRGLKSLNNAK